MLHPLVLSPPVPGSQTLATLVTWVPVGGSLGLLVLLGPGERGQWRDTPFLSSSRAAGPCPLARHSQELSEVAPACGSPWGCLPAEGAQQHGKDQAPQLGRAGAGVQAVPMGFTAPLTFANIAQ